MADKSSNRTPKTGWAAFWLRLKYRLGWLDDELKQRQQVGALPYQIVDGQLVVLLVTSSTRQRWVLPKGGIEDGETPAEAALREAQEEAGVTGKIAADPVGSYNDLKLGKKRLREVMIDIFPLRVKKQFPDWDEDGKRHRQWVTCDEARRLVSIPDLVPIITSLERQMNEDAEASKS